MYSPAHRQSDTSHENGNVCLFCVHSSSSSSCDGVLTHSVEHNDEEKSMTINHFTKSSQFEMKRKQKSNEKKFQ